MATHIRSALVSGLLLIALGAVAEEFFLRDDATGKTLGPFQTDAGSTVKLGASSFTVVKGTNGLSAAEATLGHIVIPDLDFRQATLTSAVDFLSEICRELDPKKTGVNFIIARRSPAKKMPAPDSLDGVIEAPDFGPMITMSLNKVSALEVLKAVMTQTGYTYTASGNTITIHPNE